MKEKRIVTLFPHTSNIHLVKDVGMVPFILHKVAGYHSTIACYDNGAYPYLETEVKGLNIVFIERKFGNEILDGLWFILRKRREYDILMCFHLLNISLLWLYFFKLLKGKKGRTYLKMDANLRILHADINKVRFAGLVKRMIRSIDLITVETKQLQEFLNTQWKLKTKLIPNGFFDGFERRDTSWEEKENLIITVGRIGDKNKSNEILLEAFSIFHKKKNNWKLKLVGPIDPLFETYIDNFFIKNPELKGIVEFTENITDRNALHSFYAKSKIFVLTSKSEGFPLVFLEALKAGCYILTSATTAAQDITSQQQFGKIFAVDDIEHLAKLLLEVSESEALLAGNTEKVQDFVYENFYWPVICQKIDQYLYP